MPIQDFGTNDDQTVKLWSKLLSHETFPKTYVSKFLTKNKNGLLWLEEDLSKTAGDRIRVSLRLLMDGEGVTEDEVLEGNEEPLRFAADNVLINETAHGTRWHDVISAQRVPWNMRTEGKDALGDWFAEKFDQNFFNQIGGNSGETSLKRVGHNVALAPTSTTGNTRMIIGPPSSPADAESSLSSTASQSFQLPIIDRVRRLAAIATPIVKGVMTDGVERHVLFISPGQEETLKTDIEASPTRIKWQEIQLAAMAGGQISNNPIFTGAIGMYANTIIHVSQRLPTVAGSAGSVRRAIYCGRGAAAWAWGRNTKGFSKLDWNEETFDHGRQAAVKAGAIFGVKKLQFVNRAGATVDYGTFTITTREPDL